MAKKQFNPKNNTSLPMVCAWCNKIIDGDEPVVTLKAKATPLFDIAANRGTVIDMTIESINRTVPVIVTAEDSSAAKEGIDLMIMICSTHCGTLLKEALADDLTLLT